ncbi:MAG: MSMEG_6728 family protein [Acidimicrobiia bacterium]|nr:MSMEG_6728 family protein [Acidimicrobiia bacterium]
MQTFLPYPDFEASARVLDTKRLGKQRVEVIQVVRALTVPSYAWKSHPAVLMWSGYEEALGTYGLVVSRTWCERGFDDTCAATIAADLARVGVGELRPQAELAAASALPPWLGDEGLHRSHRSALLRKDPAAYGEVFRDVPDDLPYVWPVRAPGVLEAEARREAAAAARAARQLEKARLDAEKAARRRSRAAKKAARTRRENQRRAAG